ncbi:MAG: DUF4861 domain-containing protein [Prevotella sp.]|nr:DUF4861 domain-containing protein [Prevotella sp.]
MKRLFFAFLLMSAASFSEAKTLRVEVKNPTKQERTCVPVVIDLSSYGLVRSASVTGEGSVVSQLDDLDQDGIYEELCFLTSLSAKETKTFTVELKEEEATENAQESRVYVEMLLSNKKVKEQNKHDLYISSLTVDRGVNPYNQLHHHGAAFENNLVGYRIYFDHRQTVDIYGKYLRGLELRDTQFYPDETQKKNGYGDDILWVGSTFGLGTLRGYDGTQPTMINDVMHRTQRILSRGPLRTVVEVVDEGWLPDGGKERITMITRYTLYADRRDCQVEVNIKPYAKLERPDSRTIGFSTGIINVKNSVEFSDKHGLRGCWGTDWPVSEKDSLGHKRETVGLGISLPQQTIVKEWEADKDNYGYEVRIPNNHLQYYITFGSDNEGFGYHSADAWFEYLRQWKKDITNPAVIRTTLVE